MWSKDLINELIASVKELPEQIGEVLSRRGLLSASDGNRPVAGGTNVPGAGGGSSRLSDASNIEGILRNISVLLPGFARNLLNLGLNAKRAIESFDQLGRQLRGTSTSRPGSAAPSQAAERFAQNVNETVRRRPQYINTSSLSTAEVMANRARTAQQSRQAMDQGFADRARWMETVKSATAPAGATGLAAGLAGVASRASWAEMVKAAKPRPGTAEAEQAAAASGIADRLDPSSLKAAWGGRVPRDVAKAYRRGNVQLPPDLLTNITPSFLRRYKLFGSLVGLPGSEDDAMGFLFDKNPLIRDAYLAGMPDENALKRIGRRAGLPVPRGFGGAGGIVPPRVRFTGSSTAGRGGLPDILRETGAVDVVDAARGGGIVPPRVRVTGWSINRPPGTSLVPYVPEALPLNWKDKLGGLASSVGKGLAGIDLAGLATGALKFTGAIGAATSATIALANAAIKAGPTLSKMTDEGANQFRSYGQYNASIANAFANYDLQKFRRGMQLSGRLQDSVSSVLGSANAAQDSLMPHVELAERFKAAKSTFLSGFAHQFGVQSGPLMKKATDLLGKDEAENVAWRAGAGAFNGLRGWLRGAMGLSSVDEALFGDYPGKPIQPQAPKMPMVNPIAEYLEKMSAKPMRPSRLLP